MAGTRSRKARKSEGHQNDNDVVEQSSSTQTTTKILAAIGTATKDKVKRIVDPSTPNTELLKNATIIYGFLRLITDSSQCPTTSFLLTLLTAASTGAYGYSYVSQRGLEQTGKDITYTAKGYYSNVTSYAGNVTSYAEKWFGSSNAQQPTIELAQEEKQSPSPHM